MSRDCLDIMNDTTEPLIVQLLTEGFQNRQLDMDFIYLHAYFCCIENGEGRMKTFKHSVNLRIPAYCTHAYAFSLL